MKKPHLKVGRPKGTTPARALLTRRVRRLIDLAYGGNIRQASLMTGLPYATLRDLYSGRTQNPGIRTLQVLADRHGFSEQWFLREDQGEPLPMGGWAVFFPPAGRLDVLEPFRDSFIPHAAWQLAGIYRDLGEYLESLPPTPNRPVLGMETEEMPMHLRLTRFLFGPLLAAEEAGQEIIHTGTWDNERWLATLIALGRFWEQAIADLLAKARKFADARDPNASHRWMGYNPDREAPGGGPK
jgi:hypothetical protein